MPTPSALAEKSFHLFLCKYSVHRPSLSLSVVRSSQDGVSQQQEAGLLFLPQINSHDKPSCVVKWGWERWRLGLLWQILLLAKTSAAPRTNSTPPGVARSLQAWHGACLCDSAALDEKPNYPKPRRTSRGKSTGFLDCDCENVRIIRIRGYATNFDQQLSS